MICPRCKANNSADESFCIKCGARLEGIAAAPERREKNAEPWFKLKNKKIALIGVGVVVLLVIILAVVIYFTTRTSKSEELASYLASGIGHDISDFDKLENIELQSKSTYSGVTDYIKFDRLCESEDSIVADGVTLPEWLVCIRCDDEKVSSVILYDFTVLKDTYKGEKLDGEIKLSSYSSGDSLSKVKSSINVNPYSIEYTSDSETYTYKYYYNDTAGNEQARMLTVKASDGDYLSSETSTVFPAGLDG